MRFAHGGGVVMAFQMIGVIYFEGKRMPAFSWIVRVWHDDDGQMVTVMAASEFRRTFGEREAA